MSAYAPAICALKSSVFCLKLDLPVLLQINFICSCASCDGNWSNGSSIKSSSLNLVFYVFASPIRLSICSCQVKCSRLFFVWFCVVVGGNIAWVLLRIEVFADNAAAATESGCS